MSALRSASLRAVLEGDLSWRRVEVKDLRNLIAGDAVERVKATYKRALIVLLYAHLEGFVRAALEEYARSINDAAIKVSEAKKQLSAACLSESFKKYRSPEAGDPTDLSGSRARQVMRDAELVESILHVRESTIVLDVGKVCSTDSNLTPTVLRRNLAMLALDDLVFHRFVNTLDGLLKRRNAIAHGENVKVREGDDLSGLERDVFDLCETLMRAIYEAVRDESYRRVSS